MREKRKKESASKNLSYLVSFKTAEIENISIKLPVKNIWVKTEKESGKTAQMFHAKFIKVNVSTQEHPKYLKLYTVIHHFGIIKLICIDRLNSHIFYNGYFNIYLCVYIFSLTQPGWTTWGLFWNH